MKVAKVGILILHEKYKYHSICLHIRILPSHLPFAFYPPVRPHFTLLSVRFLPSHPSVRLSAVYPSASAFYSNSIRNIISLLIFSLSIRRPTPYPRPTTHDARPTHPRHLAILAPIAYSLIKCHEAIRRACCLLV